jgi:hypothetical protein
VSDPSEARSGESGGAAAQASAERQTSAVHNAVSRHHVTLNEVKGGHARYGPLRCAQGDI